MAELITLTSPPYKGENGHWLTNTLFYERWIKMSSETQAYLPIFSLYEDKPGYVNARKTFVELEDPTGYRWAMKYLGSYQHWEWLTNSDWFTQAVEVWKSELRAKLKADAVAQIRKIAESASPQAWQASKYLASGEYDHTSKGRGRPSKAEVRGELKRAIDTITELDNDGKRIGLN